MNRQRLLARQLARQLGVVSAEDEAELFAQLDAIAAREGGAVGAALRGLRGFVEQVDQSYARYDRDLALASRSLEISSSELLDANARVRADVAVKQRALGHLRQAFRQLAERAGLPHIGDDDSGLEALAERLGALVAAHDQAQRALQASEAKFRALTELSTDWYWEQDAELRFVSTAGRTRERGGLAPQDHIGAQRWSLPNTQPVNTTWAAHRAALAARETFHDLMLRRETAAGATFFVEVSGAPIFGADGRFAGYRGVARDVTARVLAEAALRQAKQAADAASAAKSRFLANVSHEIRTPMNGLLGMAELMLDEPLSATQLERLRLIRECGASLLAIINDILDVSKIEAGKLELERIEFDPRATFAQSIAIYEVQARAKGLALDVDLALPHRAWLVGDPLRLSQVLGNLLSNAVKFTQRGGVKLQVAFDAADAASPDRIWLRLAVEDSGVGIAADVAATLFQPFTQADAATTRRHGGTGLGLAIAKHLTELMGGRIGLGSEPGRGSRFLVELPFALADGDFATTVTTDHAIDRWAGRRVLLVEDNAVNVIVARQHLERLGLSVRIADNGAAALDALDAEPFDIVLMDCQMPVMDGYQAVRRWRAAERKRLRGASGRPARQPVVALTANTMAGDRERSLAAGFDDHLGKPFTRAELRLMLARWFVAVDTA